MLIASLIFSAEGADCGVSGCAPIMAGQGGSFQQAGAGISILRGLGEFATVSTANGSVMRIGNDALQKLQGGQRVRLVVRKRKAPGAEAPAPSLDNSTNASAVQPAGNATDNGTIPSPGNYTGAANASDNILPENITNGSNILSRRNTTKNCAQKGYLTKPLNKEL